MATAKFCDNYTSTLASPYTSGGTTLIVTSAGTGDSTLPTSGDFYVTVAAEGANTTEVFLCTARSGTTLTVAGAKAGTSASNHASGATIKGVILTTATLTQMKQDIASSMTVTAFDAETSTGTSNPGGRAVVYLSDGLYTCVWNGSSWDYYYGSKKVTRPPAVASFTWVNQGSATGVDAGVTILKCPAESGDNQHLLMASLGSWTSVTVLIAVSQHAGGFTRGGLALRESGTGKIRGYGFYDSSSLVTWTLTSATSGTSNTESFNCRDLAFMWLRVTLNGSNLDLYHSNDGLTFTLWKAVALTTGFTTAPDQWGITLSPNNNTHGTSVTLISAAVA